MSQLFQCVCKENSDVTFHEDNSNEMKKDSTFYSYEMKLEPNKIILCNYKGYTKPDLEMGTYILKGNEFFKKKTFRKHKEPKYHDRIGF